jgi:hypothetical protein
MGLHLHLLRIGNGMLLRSRLYTLAGAPTHARLLLTTVTAGPPGKRKLRCREGVANAGRYGKVGRRSRGSSARSSPAACPPGANLNTTEVEAGTARAGAREV